MKNFNLSYFLLLISFSCLTSCTEPIGASEVVVPVEATAIITDAKGKVLKNRLISVSGYAGLRQTGLTDENGRAHFSFLWSVYNESGSASWALQPVEDTLFKMVHLMISPTNGGSRSSKITITDSLQMDSLTNFKVRVKIARSDVSYLSLSVLHEGMEPLPDPIKGYESFSGAQTVPFVPGQNSNFIIKQKRKRIFLEHGKNTSTPLLDTTLQMRVFAHTPFTINCGISYKNNTDAQQKRTVSATASRDSVVLIQF